MSLPRKQLHLDPDRSGLWKRSMFALAVLMKCENCPLPQEHWTMQYWRLPLWWIQWISAWILPLMNFFVLGFGLILPVLLRIDGLSSICFRVFWSMLRLFWSGWLFSNHPEQWITGPFGCLHAAPTHPLQRWYRAVRTPLCANWKLFVLLSHKPGCCTDQLRSWVLVQRLLNWSIWTFSMK